MAGLRPDYSWGCCNPVVPSERPVGAHRIPEEGPEVTRYERMIAKAIRAQTDMLDDIPPEVRAIADGIASALADHNPRFDREKWLCVCGIWS